MQLKIKLDDPLEAKKQISHTMTVKNKSYIRQLIDMMDRSMIIIPIQLSIMIDGEIINRNIIVSSPLVSPNPSINAKPQQYKLNTIKESKPISFWKRIFKR